MKKRNLTVIMLVIILTLSLAACDVSGVIGGAGGDGTADTGEFDANNIDFASIMSGMGGKTIIYSELPPEQRQAFIDAAKEDGVTVSFGADGSMTAVTDDGSTVVQKADGTWTVKGEDGSEGQIGGEWPTNEFTKLVPKPDFAVYAAGTTETNFSVAFKVSSLDEVKAYVEKVKAAGFTIEEETSDESYFGITFYTFKAKNSKGYLIEIATTSGINAITISKEE